MNKFITTSIAALLAFTGAEAATASQMASLTMPQESIKCKEWKIDVSKRFSRETQGEVSVAESQHKPFKEITYTDEIITNPEGTESMYSTSGNYLKPTGFAWVDYHAGYVVTGEDKEDIYMRNFLISAGMGSDVYVRGYYVEAEDLWHFPSGQLVGTIEGKNLYFGCLGLTSSDELLLMDDGLFEIGEDYSYISQIAYSIVGQEFLACYDEDGSVWGPVSELDLEKVEKTVAVAPENAATKIFNISYDCCGESFDTDPLHMENFCEMAIDGSDVYLRNFDYAMGSWIKGELNDNGDIFIPSDQLLGVNGDIIEYLYIKKGNKYNLTDSNGMWLYFDSANNSYASEPDTYLAMGVTSFSIEVHHWNYSLTPAVETYGKPQKPQLYDVYLADGVYNIYQLMVSEIDENGDTMNPDNMYVRVYHNGQPYLFSPDKYGVEEETYELPYNRAWVEYFDNGEWTMAGRIYPGYMVVFREDTDWVEFELVYKAGGEEYVSDRLDYANYGLPFVKTPSAPQNLSYNDENGCLSFDIELLDEEGTPMNPDRVYWRLYIDGELYVFTPNDYLFLFDYDPYADPIDLLAYYTLTWDDMMNDWWGNYESINIYLHPIAEFNTLSVEALYINGEQTRVSQRATLAHSGVNQSLANEDAECEYFTIDGKYVGKFRESLEKDLKKGIYIKRQNGISTKLIK